MSEVSHSTDHVIISWSLTHMRFPNAWIIAGSKHISDNLLANSLGKMQLCPRWHSDPAVNVTVYIPTNQPLAQLAALPPSLARHREVACASLHTRAVFRKLRSQRCALSVWILVCEAQGASLGGHCQILLWGAYRGAWESRKHTVTEGLCGKLMQSHMSHGR